MDYYSRTRPNLISSKIRGDIDKLVTRDPIETNNINDNITKYIMKFYSDYIKPNAMLLFIITVISGVLYYRYREKKNKEREELIDDLEYLIRSHEEKEKEGRGRKEEFNPLYPIKQQNTTIQYLPNGVPVNNGGETINFYNQQYNSANTNTGMPNFNYNYNNVYQRPSRSYYSGTQNPYQRTDGYMENGQNIPGYPTTFNADMDRYIKYMTGKNNEAVDYQKMMELMDKELQNLKVGPEYLDTDTPDLSMEPPYAMD